MGKAFNIGRDATLSIMANGSPLNPSILTEFSAKQTTIDLKSRPLNTEPQHQIIPDGWTFTCTYDRADSTLDDYFAQAEDQYYQGLNASDITIYQDIKDANTGAVSTYAYTGAVLKLADGGTFKAEERVTYKVEGMASRRKKVN